MPRRLAGKAIAPIIALTALLAPVTASAYTVTVHVHGAGAVQEVFNKNNQMRNVLNCTVGPGGKSNASVQDCVGGSASGNWAWGDIVRLQEFVPAAAAARGWAFDHWTDGTAAQQINCDPQPTTGDFTSPIYCEFQIFDNLWVDLYFKDSQGPADTAIASSGPSGVTKQTTASFTFGAASDPDATFQCKLDRPGALGSFVTCGGPADKSEGYTSLTVNGQYTFAVRAVDPSGNVGNTASRSWTVDTTPPTLTLSGGPAEGSRVSSTSASFTVGAGDGSMTCTLDGAAAGCVNGPKNYTGLGQGAHTFTLAATDSAGNTASQTRHWTTDTVAPVISVTAGPAAFSNAQSGTITFTGSEPATYTCALDAATPGTCTSSVSYSGLADGQHSVAIRASDTASPANVSTMVIEWTLDTVAPDTALLDGPAAGSTSPVSRATFSFASPESGASFECRLDAGQFTACASPYTLTGLTNGDHTFEIRAVDRAGNRDGTPSGRAWRVNSLDDDADGYSRPQDCNDADPAIHPGAVDIPDDGIDQDCSGADAVNLDRDGDGYNRPQDCNDANAAVHPGATDTPGDGVDQDCSGADAPVPPLPAGIAYKFVPHGPKFTVQILKLTKLPRGAIVKIRCTGKRCPVKTKTLKAPNSGTVDVRKALKRKPLFARSKLTLQASAPGYITKVVTFDLSLGKAKGGTFRCEPPGAKKPQSC